MSSRMELWTGTPIRASAAIIPNAHVCHGPDGEGSTYAPALKNSVKTINYAEFYGIVVGGRQNLGGGENKVMPALGDNKNVMCYIDDIYVYLRARSNDAVRSRKAAEA